MQVQVSGKKVKLDQRNFISQGGEASVYAEKGVAYKIYTDPSHMPHQDKLTELSKIKQANIIKPLDIVRDQKGKPVGYTMSYVNKSHSLCRLFTKTFRNKYNLKPNDIADLVALMRNTIQHIHDVGILIVDLNEMNHLVDQKFNNVYFIDVDSYQTPSFPATVIMESIRDRHSKTFSDVTDWFSFGIISFQMFIGVHPYKGKHPTYTDIDDRMKRNLSVLNADVTVPKICQPFDVIPDGYKAWYEEIFERGERIPPPDAITAKVLMIKPKIKTVVSVGFDIEEVQEITGSFVSGGPHVLTTEGLYQAMGGLDTKVPSDACITRSSEGLHALYLRDGILVDYNVARGTLHDTKVPAESIICYDYVTYIKRGTEILFTEPWKNTIIQKVAAQATERSTIACDGCFIQNMLGAIYATILPIQGQSYQVRLNEIVGERIISAKYDMQVLVVITELSGRYNRYIFKLSDDFKKYYVRKMGDVDQDINFTVLSSGILVSIWEDGKLELTTNRIGHRDIKVIEDATITKDMRLYSTGAQTMFAMDNKLFKLSMKK